jgi:hypothetical protein
MASTVSGRPGPVPGAGGNWALAENAKIEINKRKRAMKEGCGAY